ncbi:MAG: 4'-phosphopantetheinyl transferase superfamily protein [Myxococcota bacterium]
MLGNDVVDLLDVDARPETFRARFDQRVCSAEERLAIANDSDSHARRWAHWAAKEAAYKLARQIDPTFVFAPSRLVAVFSPVAIRRAGGLERRGTLEFERSDLEKDIPPLPKVELRSFETAERIHLVAAPETVDWSTINFAVKRMDRSESDSSVAVRQLVMGDLGERLDVHTKRLSMGRRGRIPTLLLDGAAIDSSLSLSHHGKWIGYAFQLQEASGVAARIGMA